uniref:Uncharacterized protein n=1 Tax=Globisporangium ultimum (strain ATCC 200006 / CBS 805.95 / DAOM BR144) TaxID=431595 RepID=K3W6X5_GLOUD
MGRSGGSADARGGTDSGANPNEIAPYDGGSNGAMRLRTRSRGGHSSDSGDVVTTTHTISEMHERSRSRRRGANGDGGGDTSIRSEKRVVVKMAVRRKPRGSASSDNDDDEDDDDDRATGDRIVKVEDDYQEHDANGLNNIEEIDEGDDVTAYASNNTRPSTPAALGSSDMHMTPHVVDDATIQETMVRLVTEAERMKQFCYEQEQAFRQESELVEHLQKEYKALKVMTKEYKYRAREHKRVQRILRSARQKSDKNHSERERSKSSQRKLKSQCRQLEQYQSELALRFQLLQSENTRYEMQVERQLADLRREYTDNYLFASTSTFQ